MISEKEETKTKHKNKNVASGDRETKQVTTLIIVIRFLPVSEPVASCTHTVLHLVIRVVEERLQDGLQVGAILIQVAQHHAFDQHASANILRCPDLKTEKQRRNKENKKGKRKKGKPRSLTWPSSEKSESQRAAA